MNPLRASLNPCPVRGPVLHRSLISAISCRPRALTRPLPGLLKQVLGLLSAALLLLGGLASHAQLSPPLLAPDGVWCWFGNPRAVFKDGLLYFGYVRFSDGRVGLNTYDPQSQVSSNLWLSVMAQKDDHDNPALLPLSDGRMLAIYQKHGGEQRFYYRVTAGGNTAAAADWGPELVFTSTTAGVTYANPYQLAAESGRIYSFMRNLNFNPTFVTSDPSGTNWSAPQILIRTGTGSSRPYVQYCSDFDRRIDVTYTDGHPDVAAVPTSLYHIYYRDGALYNSAGTFLKYLANAPLLHDSGERGSLIYQYSESPTNDPNAHIAFGRAWCWDVLYHTNGAPVAAFSVQRTNVMGGNWYDDRIYYYYARWTGTTWQKRFIAHAGRPLYNTQRHYAGGISLDPNNPDVVYLASNAADPFDLTTTTNVPLRANDRYEVFRGVTADGGLTFAWQPVTTNSTVDNLRPYVPRRNSYPVGVIWYAGTYTTYTSWNTAVYGLFTTNLVPVTVVPNAGPVVTLFSPLGNPLALTNLANRLQLSATATDDGRPGPLTVSWSTVSGPANAVFDSQSNATTSVAFPQAGFYRLRLGANDTLLTNSVDLAVLAGNVGPPTNDPSLALWLKLNETSGGTASDSSGNGNDGILSGSGTWNPTGGPRAGALELNGTNSFVNVPDAPNLDNTSAFTLAYWFRAYSYTSGGAGLVSKRNTLSDNNAYTSFLQTDHLIYVDIDGSNNRFSSATAFSTNQWYHVAISFDGSQATNQRARLYVNGILDKVAAENSAAVPNFNSSLKVGLTHSNVTTYLNGAMADVRFYRRALAESEVAWLATLASAPSVAPGPPPAATNHVPALLTGAASDDGSSGPLAAQWSVIGGPGTATFGATNQPTTAVTFMAAGQYVLRLAAGNDSATVFSDLAVSVNPNPNLYADWVALAFPGQTNAAILATGADPENDGGLNLLEFALGMNPSVPDAHPFAPGQPGLPIGAIQTFAGTNYLTLTVKRPIGRLNLVYAGEVSGDLAQWSEAALAAPPVNNGDGTETAEFRDTIPVSEADRRFVRLRVSLE